MKCRHTQWFSAGLLLMALLHLAPGALAEVRRLEVVGAVPLDPRTRATSIPRDGAIQEALWEGVSRMAESLLVDAELPEAQGDSHPLREVLGKDMLPFTRGFRIIDDQGERPALFSESPEIATEYVVVVEVHVDVDRVKERLVAAGLLARSGGDGELRTVVLELQGLDLYPGYAELVATLEGEAIGARSVTPLSFERGRILLQVRSGYSAADLLDRLLGQAPGGLELTPLGLGGQQPENGAEHLVLRARWVPPAPEPKEGTVSPVGAPGPWGR
jgi:hypothetical protein